MPEKRIFVAIHYPLSQEFLAWFRQLKKEAGETQVKWTAEANFHLTLKFIGDTPDPNIQRLVSALQEISYNYSPFEIIPRGLGYFGSLHAPRVFWTGLDDPKHSLPALATAVDEVCHTILNTETENQPFKAHLTLGRPKNFSAPQLLKDLLRKYGDISFPAFTVNQFLLVWSTLTPQGPVYKTLHTFPLKGELSI